MSRRTSSPPILGSRNSEAASQATSFRPASLGVISRSVDVSPSATVIAISCCSRTSPPILVAQDEVDRLWADENAWTDRVVRNIAGMGRFSATAPFERVCDRIWQMKPIV